MQFVITTDGDYQQLDRVAGELIGRALGSGRFMFLKKSIDFTRPKTTILIDHDRAGDLGISMETLGINLAI